MQFSKQVKTPTCGQALANFKYIMGGNLKVCNEACRAVSAEHPNGCSTTSCGSSPSRQRAVAWQHTSTTLA
eukprot:4568711-Amphidinium_carterae.2